MEQILRTWQDSFVKGTFSYWVLLGLHKHPRTMQELREYILLASRNQVAVDDNSLYRTLRRLYDISIIDFQMVKNRSGPDRKLYELTESGEALLAQFTKDTIIPLTSQPYVQKISKEHP